MAWDRYPERRISRRRLLEAGAAGTLAAAVGSARAAGTAARCDPPPRFPPGIALSREDYANWTRDITAEGLWTCAPRTPGEVPVLADWARSAGRRLRPRGRMHGFSPLTIESTESCASRSVLVDTTRHLTEIEILDEERRIVRVQTGATMGALLDVLDGAGLGLTAVPAPGDLTVGGVLAVAGHGTGVPVAGEVAVPGTMYGSLSDRVTALTAVVWDRSRRRYVLRRFRRSDPRCAPFLTHLGRAFVTEVELRVARDVNLRCVSDVSIPAAELFADPRETGVRTVQRALESHGRLEVIWFPFSERPWLKTWSVEPTRPAGSREVMTPYNYTFSDTLPAEVSEIARAAAEGRPEASLLLGRAAGAATGPGLTLTRSADIWGRSRNLLLYVRPTTLRAHANGYAVLCRRSDVQTVVHRFVADYSALLERSRARDEYPVSIGVEIRVTGLDRAREVGGRGARVPTLSALHPRRDHPDRDTAVWLDVLTFFEQRGAQRFLRDLEQAMLVAFGGGRFAIRPEWSKGWAYSGATAWDDEPFLRETRREHRRGRRTGESWDDAVRALDAADPHRVFTNGFLDRLMVARRAGA